MAPHFERQYGNREHDPDPEAAAHVEIFRTRSLFCCRDLRLERHAADRAVAGTRLPYLGMHRTSVDRALRDVGSSRLRHMAMMMPGMLVMPMMSIAMLRLLGSVIAVPVMRIVFHCRLLLRVRPSAARLRTDRACRTCGPRPRCSARQDRCPCRENPKACRGRRGP